MIKAKVNNKEYQIKTSWSELTYGEYLEIVEAKDEVTSVSLLTGISVELLCQMNEDSLNDLTTCLEFLKDFPEGVSNLEEKNIREESFGQKVMFQQLITDKSEIRALGLSIAIYNINYKEVEESFLEVLKLPFTDVYLLGLKYIEQLTKICEAEAEHLKADTSSEQKRAGIDMFNEFGIMNTIDSLANGNVLNYEKVLQIDYNTIFIKLKMCKFANTYKENYSKIMSKKR